MTSPAPDASRSPAFGDRRLPARDGRLRAALLSLCLLLPFVIVIVAQRGLVVAFKTFHGDDEAYYHLPIVREFLRTFPHFDLHNYHSATTPLAYVWFALVGHYLGDSLSVLRMANVVVSFVASLVLFRFFSRRPGWTSAGAFAAALCVALSPYVFGTSFLVMTDNLAVLCMAASLGFAFDYLERDRGRSFVLACLAASLAVMTRQLYVWLLAGLALAVFRRARRQTAARTWAQLGAVALSLLPYAALCEIWGGAVPPEFRRHESLNPAAAGLSLAVLGAYGGLFLVSETARNSKWRDVLLSRKSLLAVLGAGLVLLVGPLHYSRGGLEKFPTDGYLWRLGQHFPDTPLGSLPLVCLALVGSLVLTFAWSRNTVATRAAFTAYACFALAHVLQGSLYQKYFDVVPLIAALLVFGDQELSSRHFARLIVAGYCLAFAVYAVVPMVR